MITMRSYIIYLLCANFYTKKFGKVLFFNVFLQNSPKMDKERTKKGGQAQRLNRHPIKQMIMKENHLTLAGACDLLYKPPTAPKLYKTAPRGK